MKRKWFINSLCFLLMFALLLSGCKGAGKESSRDATDKLQQELSQQYQSAVDALAGQDVALKVKYQQTVTVAGQAYEESGKITLEYWSMGAEDFVARAALDVSFGDRLYETEVVDIYSGGQFYQKLNNDLFYGEITAEAFVEQNVPVKMLDPTLYTLSREESKILFTDAVAAESWLAPEDAVIQNGHGEVELDEQGKLKQTEYTVTYQYGAAQYALEYQVSIDEPGKKPSVPEDLSEYVLLDNNMAAYALEHAYGYLSQARHLSSRSSSIILSAAAGLALQENQTVDTYAVDDQYAMKWESNMGITDYSTNQTEEYKSVEKFVDGKYTISEDGGRETSESGITQDVVESVVEAHMVSQITVNSNIASVETTHLGNVLLFEYTGTEQMGQDYCEELSLRLFQDGDFLDDYASAYETKKMTFYLGLDGYSMLPTAVGVQYEGVHTIDGMECVLSQQVDQSFDLASLTSYEEIYEEPAPETEPETKATPLFYQVTGADGQQMWLLGTIHIGDERTGFLPQEIYDAFSSADALAVECDTESFEEEMEEGDNEELTEQIAEYYFYSDGTASKDHIETPELYESAIQLLKATGNYYYNSEYEKLFLWGNGLDQFYLKQGYSLSGDKGVESRLMDLAEEKSMKVLEVESTIFQIRMMSDYSDNLQEMMLFSSMATNSLDYNQQTQELYEKWCAGDEAALTEALKEEPWEFKEEDFDLTELTGDELERAQAVLDDLDNINAQLAELQKEYEKAMSADRNKDMVEVAKQYLESGETVFYAVGLAHLLADDGLVNSLREAGYTVELVTYS